MKKLILIAALFLTACTERDIIVIDGCEYIRTINYNGQFGSTETLAHKGNCINPIHEYNQSKDTVSADNSIMIKVDSSDNNTITVISTN